MAGTRRSDRSRRDFLRLGWTIAAGLALPPVLSGCPGDDDGAPAMGPAETFVEPRILASENGLLDVTLTFAYLSTVLDGKPVTLRNMFGSIPAPTLRVNAGDTLRIHVVNQLPPNPQTNEPTKHLRYPNSTNLHTHGLHVTPGTVSPGVFGDFVMDDPALGVQPGASRQHEYRIGADHPPGAYFYHPHLHGATALQVGSGMAGALLVKGAIDKVPEIGAARERVFVFQAPVSDANGRLESFSQVTDTPDTEPPFLVNGVRRPRLVLRRGEVQNWHFVNAGIFRYLNLSLDAHVLNVYGYDGNPRAGLKPVGPIAAGDASLPEGVVLAPANRASVLVQGGAPGTYYLRSLGFRMDSDAPPLAEDIVAEVVVVDEPLPMALPAGPLPVPPMLAPITDEELANAGGLKRIIFLAIIFNPPPTAGAPIPPITDPPASGVVHPGDELADWIYQTDGTTLANKVFAIGTAGTEASTRPGPPSEYIPFQSARALRQTVALGSVEEWTIFNANTIRHPFHIHINPCWVTKVNGKPVEPYWTDTIALPPDGTLTFRSRFVDFSGAYVMHCHMFAHEDMGMMQTIEVV